MVSYIYSLDGDTFPSELPINKDTPEEAVKEVEARLETTYKKTNIFFAGNIKLYKKFWPGPTYVLVAEAEREEGILLEWIFYPDEKEQRRNVAVQLAEINGKVARLESLILKLYSQVEFLAGVSTR